MAGKHHATISIEDAIVMVSGYIIEELENGSIGIFGGISLLLAELVEISKEFFINSSSIVYEGTNNGLDAEDALGV